jgi:hypothetical protein
MFGGGESVGGVGNMHACICVCMTEVGTGLSSVIILNITSRLRIGGGCCRRGELWA